MDSKRMRRALFAMVGMFLLLIAVIALMNLDTVKSKLGLAQEPEREMATIEETETDGGQIGNDLSAFLRDETFFDEEPRFKSIETYSGRNVFLMMSSVAKDLRVMVVDSVGRLVTGAPFTIEVQGGGEYTDEDEDGIIYIEGLRAGEYAVSLQELEGFHVPNTVTTRTSSIGYWIILSI